MIPLVCPHCKITISPKEEGDKVFIECTNCGYRREVLDWVEHTCSKCKCEKAIVVYHATTIADESTTTLYKCVRCGNTEREGFMS